MTSFHRNEEILNLTEDRWLSISRDSSTLSPKATVIICHGLTGDKVGPQKLLTNIARLLATSCSVEVLRFDFCGAGLSSGAFEKTQLSSMCADALEVANIAKRPLIWVGISTGALIALIATAKRGKKEPLIAISNGFSDSIKFTDLDTDPVPLRKGQLYLSRKYFLERSRLCPRSQYFNKAGPISVVMGSSDENHYCEALALQKLGTEVYTVNKSDHLFTMPEHRKQLFDYLKGKIHEFIRNNSLSHC